MTNVIALGKRFGHPLPYTSGTEKGVIQADIPNEKLRIHSKGQVVIADGHESMEPPPLWGAHAKGSGELLIDGGSGVAAFRGKFSAALASGMPLGPVEYCVHVKLPQQMFPPKQMVQAQLQQGEQMVDAQMAQLPPHEDDTIDGVQVAVWKKPMGPPGSGAPTGYLALRLNGAPFGVGFLPPASGEEWHPLLKFPKWEHGAGHISDFSCVGAHHSSAAALVAHPEARRILDVYDEVLARIRTVDSMDTAFASFPQRPSELFHEAAAKELNMVEASIASDMHYTPVIVIAGVAGAAGAFVALAMMKLAKQWSTSSRHEALLSMA
jgi:hypothetical protein